MRRGAGEKGAAIAAGGEDDELGAEAVDRAVVELQADDAAAAAILHDEVDGEIFDEEFGIVAQRLPVERVQHGVAGAVGGGAGALRRRPPAEIGGHAAERALIDAAVLGARERHAPMFEFVDGGGRVAAEIFDRILIAEPVRPLDGVVHVPFPVVRPHIGERGGDAALRGHRMRARREHLADAGRAQSRLRAADGRAQTRAAGADDDDVETVIGDRIGGADPRWRLRRRSTCRSRPFCRLSNHCYIRRTRRRRITKKGPHRNQGEPADRPSFRAAKIRAAPRPAQNRELATSAHSLAWGE